MEFGPWIGVVQALFQAQSPHNQPQLSWVELLRIWGWWCWVGWGRGTSLSPHLVPHSSNQL